jgi:hypothetical protein
LIGKLELTFRGCNLTRTDPSFFHYVALILRACLALVSALNFNSQPTGKILIVVMVLLFFIMELYEIFFNQPFMVLQKIRLNVGLCFTSLTLGIISAFYMVSYGAKSAREDYFLQTCFIIISPIIYKVATRYIYSVILDQVFLAYQNENEALFDEKRDINLF